MIIVKKSRDPHSTVELSVMAQPVTSERKVKNGVGMTGYKLN